MKKFSLSFVMAIIALFVSSTATAQCMLTSFIVTPSTITAGDSCTLSWSTNGNCNSLYLNGVPVTGNSIVVKPFVTTSYVISYNDNNSSGGLSVIVTVNLKNPPCMVSNITATPSTIVIGNPTTITWDVNSGCNSNYTWDVNGVSVKGPPYIVYPTTTTTYIVSGHGTNGSSPSQSVEVIVQRNASVAPNSSPDEICGNSKHQQLVKVDASSLVGSGSYTIYSLFISDSGATSCLSNITMQDLGGSIIGIPATALPAVMNPNFTVLKGTTQRMTFLANTDSCFGTVFKLNIDSMLVKIISTGKFEMWRQPLSSSNIKIVDCSTHTGINKAPETSNVSVYPNPVIDKLTIETSSTEEIQIFNMNGALVLSTKNHDVDVSSFTPGIYILKINNETKKFIKN